MLFQSLQVLVPVPVLAHRLSDYLERFEDTRFSNAVLVIATNHVALMLTWDVAR
jgi:hypothetical protein